MRVSISVVLMCFLTLFGRAAFAAADENLTLEAQLKSDNLFSTSFVESKPSNAKRLSSDEPPKLFAGKDKIEDKHRMEERGFELLGYSDFQAGEIPPEMVIPQAKKLRADTVLLYSERVSAVPASVKIQQMRDKSAAQAGDKPAVSYKYFASYWVKLAKPSFGVHVKVPEKDEQFEGLQVMVVVDGSAAQRAGVLKDDILVSIGDVTFESVDDLTKAVQQYAGQTVGFVFIRDRMRHQEKLKLD